jgi:hypothetical protein
MELGFRRRCFGERNRRSTVEQLEKRRGCGVGENLRLLSSESTRFCIFLLKKKKVCGCGELKSKKEMEQKKTGGW